jgi:hypothetical protein
LHQKYGQDPRFFKTVSLENFAFQKRVIGVMVDGNLLGEFDKLINNVTVTLRKTHEDSTTTVREIQLNKTNLNTNHFPSMVYGTIGDKDKLLWLNYEYQLKYNFIGGKHYKTAWIPQSNAMINVTSPYQRKKVSLDADLSFLEKQRVRAIIVRLEYPFFGEIQQMAPLTLKPKELLKEPFFEMTLPIGAFEYTYYITWILQDHTEKQVKGNSNTSILFIDNMK